MEATRDRGNVAPAGDETALEALALNAFRSAPVPLLVIDERQVIRLCNVEAGCVLAVSHEDVIGRELDAVLREAAADLRLVTEPVSGTSGRLTATVVRLTEAGSESAAEALRRLNRRKDEFLAVLAHELRGPLAPLRNGVHLARKIGTADSGLASLLAMMDRQLGVLGRLVDDLLDVGRIGSGKLQLAMESLVLHEVLEASCEAVRRHLETSEHQLMLHLHDAPCPVRADRSRLQQVFTNLLSNAAKYSDHGTPIEVTLTCTGTQACVEVRDHGVGLAEEELEEIFNMYSQVRLHRARAEGGLGIGLSLVRQLVELHGGQVRARSDGRGRGSTFSVSLPLEGQEPRQPS